MKTFCAFPIVIGLILLTGIFLITIYSKALPDFVKTVVFVFLGYLGLALFAVGWMRCFRGGRDE